MRFSVPANFDPQFISQLLAYPVEEVYGKLPDDLVGGGRPSYSSPPVSRQQLTEYLRLLGRSRIRFNYLLNGSCQGNREWSRGWQKRLMRLLDRLGEMGVTTLTVCTPFLLELIKKRRPEFRIKVGLYAQVDTARRARFWQDLGADAINLESFSINRDLRRLEQIRAAVRCDLQLIPNHICLPNCPMQVYHQSGFSHASDGSGRLFIDYCLLQCARRRLEDPSLLIKSAWIRPEDAGVYEAMGYDHFKLLERGIPADELLKRVRAYAERRFDGNLAELLLPYGFRSTPRHRLRRALRYFIKPLQMNPLKIRPLYELAKAQGMLHPQERQPIVIDAGQIPGGFIQTFRNRDCAATDCEQCGYCRSIADRAVQIDPAFRQASLRQLEQVHGTLADGSLWGAGAM